MDAHIKENPTALRKTVEEKRAALRAARFSVGQKQLKNVRSVRVLKKDIARLLTALRAHGASRV